MLEPACMFEDTSAAEGFCVALQRAPLLPCPPNPLPVQYPILIFPIMTLSSISPSLEIPSFSLIPSQLPTSYQYSE